MIFNLSSKALPLIQSHNGLGLNCSRRMGEVQYHSIINVSVYILKMEYLSQPNQQISIKICKFMLNFHINFELLQYPEETFQDVLLACDDKRSCNKLYYLWIELPL